MRKRNLTLAVPENLVRRAKVIAAERDTSISELVADFFSSLSSDTDDYDEVWRAEQKLMNQGLAMSVGEVKWTRDATHER